MLNQRLTRLILAAFTIVAILLPTIVNGLATTDLLAGSPLVSYSNNSITVTSSFLAGGGTLTGVFVDLRVNGNHIQSGYTPVTFNGLQTGVQYGVVIYWYGNNYFRHFSNGNLNRYALVTLNATAGQNSYTLNGLYENVPPSQAASLNILAKFPNGTQIGTAFDNHGYPQHTPGMWLTVAPPGTTDPYTGTFTGGSILPFIFFNHGTYTVAMSLGYGTVEFSHWADNNNPDPNRAITLNGNATYTAIYVDSKGPTSVTSSTSTATITTQSSTPTATTSVISKSSSSTTTTSSSSSSTATSNTSSTPPSTTASQTSGNSTSSNTPASTTVTNSSSQITSSAAAPENFASYGTIIPVVLILSIGIIVAAALGIRRTRR